MRRTHIGQLIGAFVSGVSGVAFNPAPVDVEFSGKRIEPLPEFDVLDRFAVGGSPAFFLPAVDPACDAVAYIARVQMQDDRHGTLDGTQGLDNGGGRVSLTLQAIEIATGNTLATKSEISGRKRTTADVLCGVMAQAMVGDFMKQISTRMATKISTGQSVAVRFTIDPGSAINMDTEINNIMPLSDILVSWVKRHAKNGKYHTQGRTSTLLAFSDIFVDNSMEDGMQSDVNDFALALYQYLKGLNLSVSRTITGNSIDVIIY